MELLYGIVAFLLLAIFLKLSKLVEIREIGNSEFRSQLRETLLLIQRQTNETLLLVQNQSDKVATTYDVVRELYERSQDEN